MRSRASGFGAAEERQLDGEARRPPRLSAPGLFAESAKCSLPVGGDRVDDPGGAAAPGGRVGGLVDPGLAEQVAAGTG